LVQKFLSPLKVGRNMKPALFCAIAFSVVALAGAAEAQPISLNGSTTVTNLIVLPNKAAIEAASGQHIVVVGNGSQRGLADLVGGNAQIAMISAPLAEEVAKLNAGRPGSIDPSRLTAHAVGQSRVAFMVHPSNPVRSLSDAQLVDLLVGKIRNWKQVGGADQPVMVVAAQPGDGVRTLVEDRLLNGGALTKDTRVMPNAPQIPKVVEQVPGAIGLYTASALVSSVAELTADTPIVQPLILVTMGEESSEIRRIIGAVESVAGH
jgi:phosphate transport system substrate-binding protein